MPMIRPLLRKLILDIPRRDPKREHVRLPERKAEAVTIAAGFRFSEGVVVCADTEMTDSVQKFDSSKLMTFVIGGGESKYRALSLVFALAGTVDYARMAITQIEEAIAEEFLKAPESMTDKKIRNMVTASLLQFHEKFVFNHPLYRNGAGPVLELVIGAFSPCMGRTFLLCTRECAVNEISNSACIGQGQSFARYIIQQFWKDRLNRYEVYMLAANVLEQTKQNAPNCGKNSQFIFIDQVTGRVEPIWGLRNQHVESYSNQFMRLYPFLFYDLASAQKDFETVFTELKPYAYGLWNYYHRQRDAYEALERGMAEGQQELRRRREEAEKAKQSASQTPTPGQ